MAMDIRQSTEMIMMASAEARDFEEFCNLMSVNKFTLMRAYDGAHTC